MLLSSVFFYQINFKKSFLNTISVSNCESRSGPTFRNVVPDLSLLCLQRISADDKFVTRWQGPVEMPDVKHDQCPSIVPARRLSNVWFVSGSETIKSRTAIIDALSYSRDVTQSTAINDSIRILRVLLFEFRAL